ncbi:MAG TPA: heavy metal-binding domain-containing protein [Polyangiaceae bacterium]|nr:heavy metal-binding domain-containing protein [Polyangiaceae bacterium]
MPSLILLELAGCGSGVPPRSAALDPSNANGPESPPFDGSPGLREPAGGENVNAVPDSAEGSDQHAGHRHAAGNAEALPPSPPAAAAQAGSSDQSATYTCPMHPEVTSAQPGKCPKCGMILVSKKAEQ